MNPKKYKIFSHFYGHQRNKKMIQFKDIQEQIL